MNSFPVTSEQSIPRYFTMFQIFIIRIFVAIYRFILLSFRLIDTVDIGMVLDSMSTKILDFIRLLENGNQVSFQDQSLDSTKM